ncbi:MAG: hypothetical protein U0525_06240 [Patescibacteria group bacterium]
MQKIKNKKYIFPIIIFGFGLRIYLSTTGQNADVSAYEVVGKLVLEGKNVYAETARYNYAPVWFLFLGIAKFFADYFSNSLQALHIIVATVISMADIGLFFIIRKKYGLIPATIFFLNPISIIISGFHSQFDNVAILIAWLAVIQLTKNINSKKGLILLGLSLLVKHSFIFFTIWLFVHEDNKKLYKTFLRRLASVVIPISIFVISFLPFLSGGGWDGIWNNVINYQSFSNSPLWFFIAPIFVKENTTMTQLFIGLMIFSSIILRKVSIEKKFLIYLIMLPLCASAMANQYLVYPLIPAIVMMNPFFLIYIVMTSLYLMIDQNELNMSFLKFLIPDRLNPNIDMWRSYDWLLVSLFLGLLFVVWQKFERYKSSLSQNHTQKN